MTELYNEMSRYIDDKLNASAYGYIDLHKLFSKIVLPGTTLSTRG